MAGKKESEAGHARLSRLMLIRIVEAFPSWNWWAGPAA
jgi:hypothetical protein